MELLLLVAGFSLLFLLKISKVWPFHSSLERRSSPDPSGSNSGAEDSPSNHFPQRAKRSRKPRVPSPAEDVLSPEAPQKARGRNTADKPIDPTAPARDPLEKAERAHLEVVSRNLWAVEEEKNECRAAVAELKEALDPFLPAILSQLSALRIRRGQLVTKDHYGNIVTDAWTAEIDYFVLRTLLQDDSQRLAEMKEDENGPYPGAPYIRLTHFIDFLVQNAHLVAPKTNVELRSGQATDWSNLEPREFERLCCESLIEVGWQARTTAGSGDQGIDVVATYDSEKLVVQCKRYKGSVGNKAVQEIVAGRAFECADLAAVISTGSFTRAARELAAASGVTLIHPNQIGTTYRRIETEPNLAAGSMKPDHLIEQVLILTQSSEARALEKFRLNRETSAELFDDSQDEDLSDDSALYAQALDLLKATKRASTSMIQRRLRIGYKRAAQIMDLMEENGIVGPENGSNPREILVDLDSL